VDDRDRAGRLRSSGTAFLSRPPDAGPPDAHLRLLALPGAVQQHTGLLRVWAAVSTPVLIVWAGVLLARPAPLTLSGFTTFLAVFAAVEAVARRRVRRYLTVLAVALVGAAVVAGLVVALLDNWQLVVAVLLAGTALVLVAVNVRELSGGSGRRGGRA
jgi:hypothetical protein